MNVLVRFRHGLGDAVQLTSVLRHLRRYRPEWAIDVASLRGKHSAFYGLCRRSIILGEEQGQPYDRIIDLDWWEAAQSYVGHPSTKVERCLCEVFELEPDPSLCSYRLKIGPAAQDAAATYLQRIGAKRPVLLHYQGNTSVERKNLTHEVARAVCGFALLAGCTPIILDWDARSPIYDQDRIFCPIAGDALWHGDSIGDAEIIAALAAQTALVVAIDSGPQKVAAAVGAPLLAVWTGHHPLHFFGLSETTEHLVPAGHERLIHGPDVDAALGYFYHHYVCNVYEEVATSLLAAMAQRLGGDLEHAVSVDRAIAETERVSIRVASKTMVAFSYCSEHLKAVEGGAAKVDPDQHRRMLDAAINWHRHDGPKLVSSIGRFDGAPPDGATIVESDKNPGHQAGAQTAIVQALSAAKNAGCEYLVFLADDVLCYDRDAASKMIRSLVRGGLDYIGSHWGTPSELTTQVFGCRVEPLLQALDHPNPGMILEWFLKCRVEDLKLKAATNGPQHDMRDYLHTHDTEKYLTWYQRMCSLPADRLQVEQHHLQVWYHAASTNDSDIKEHCPILRGYAREVRHITEFGTRTAVSTAALLSARPLRLVAYDIHKTSAVAEIEEKVCVPDFTFHERDVLSVEIEPTDLLFIDTLHEFGQLRQELALHADKVRRWIILHDTTTFGERGEQGGRGLWPAVTEFLKTNSQWRVRERRENNNGLTVLERQGKYRGARKMPAGTNVLIRFRHGLGDAVQLSAIVAQLPSDWSVSVAALPGKVPGALPLSTDDAGFDRVFDLAWHEPYVCYPDSPATKVEKCLREVFEITPRPTPYQVLFTEEDVVRAAAYLRSIGCKEVDVDQWNAVVIHYQGNTSQDRKDLTHEQATKVCAQVIAAGYVPVILDWDRRSPIPDQEQVFCPGRDSELWPLRPVGDAATVAALLSLCRMVVAIDSGPQKVAGATNVGTRTLAVWTGHHPLHYFTEAAAHVTHLVPRQHADLLRGNAAAGLAYFNEHYRYSTYENLDEELHRHVAAALGVDAIEGGQLIPMHQRTFFRQLHATAYNHDYYEEHRKAGLDYLAYGGWQEDYGRWLVESLHWKGQRVLDVGCACGSILRGLRAAGAQAEGCDVSEHMIGLGRRQWPDQAKAMHVCDATNLHLFTDGHFTGIHCSQVAEHWKSELVPHILRELARVTAPGGLFFCSLDTEEVFVRQGRRIEHDDPTHIYIKPISWWHAQLAASGWSIISAQELRAHRLSYLRHYDWDWWLAKRSTPGADIAETYVDRHLYEQSLTRTAATRGNEIGWGAAELGGLVNGTVNEPEATDPILGDLVRAAWEIADDGLRRLLLNALQATLLRGPGLPRIVKWDPVNADTEADHQAIVRMLESFTTLSGGELCSSSGDRQSEPMVRPASRGDTGGGALDLRTATGSRPADLWMIDGPTVEASTNQLINRLPLEQPGLVLVYGLTQAQRGLDCLTEIERHGYTIAAQTIGYPSHLLFAEHQRWSAVDLNGIMRQS